MNISILTLFPQLYEPFVSTSLIGKAQKTHSLSFDICSLMSFCEPKERVDSPAFGPGAGMVIRPEAIQKGIEQQEQRHGKSFKIFFSPQGKKLTQPYLNELVEKLKDVQHITLFASRYEGIDARVEAEYADEVISVGDFVVMGGDVPAMLFLEGFLRLIPGVVGKQESIEHESFMGPFLDYPVYTEPVDWKGHVVPDIIRSGNHQAIEDWRSAQAVKKSVMTRFDWVRSHVHSTEDRKKAAQVIPSHFVALLHEEIDLPHGQVGTTSVTTLDIHDIARSCATFGIQNYYLVTPLKDQQRIVQTLLSFWRSDTGIDYNPSRHEAVNRVEMRDHWHQVIEAIEEKTGKKPVVIATSARGHAFPEKSINFSQQDKVWALGRPVLLLLGTGGGMARSVMEKVDFILDPIEGFTDFNHLSVRTAAGILLDRWLGINIRD